MWKKLTKIENMPSIGIDYAVQSPNVTYIRWKVHQDWIAEVRHFLYATIKKLQCVASHSSLLQQVNSNLTVT